MKGRHKKISAALLIVILISAGAIALAVSKNYPVAIVGKKFITARAWKQDLAIAGKLEANPDSARVMDQLIKVKKEQELLEQLNIGYSVQTITDEFNFIKSDKNQQYEKILNDDFSGSEQKFIDFAVLPQVYDAALRINYNSDFTANNERYAKAKDALNQLNEGKIFDDVAKITSDDKISGQLGGDLGFVSEGQILPELWKVLTKIPTGQPYPNIVISRLGYHVLYPVGTSDKDGRQLIQVKHILIQTEGYESWLSSQLKNFTVWHILGS